jgi:glycosyltransferase involved in cell wall biosynthesis
MGDWMNPQISVVVPVYNVQAFLEPCLASIAAQKMDDFEVWMVDDGSTDGSSGILKAWEGKDSRFHVVTRKNGGLSAARNTGLEHCQGRYVAFIDSDDVIAADMLKDLWQAAEQSGSGIAVSDMEYFDDSGRVSFSDGGRFTCTSMKQTPSLILINNSACNKLYRRELFRTIRFPEGKYYEDLATIPMLLCEASRVVKVNEPLYRYRQRCGSIAHSANPKIFEIYDAVDGIIAYLKDHGYAETDPVLQEARHLYVIHGLDLTTLRIKDFQEKGIRAQYLRQNMERLRRSYPEYEKDSCYQNASAKKKLIYSMLKHGQEKLVLKLYDR